MPMSKEQIRDNLKLLIISGICIGINWILLFEAFRHTTLAIASICYYMAPVFVILVSPVLLHETLTARKVVCVLLALLGMMFVSGIFENGLSGITDLSGVFFALGAAVFYASVIVCNKKFSPISAYDKTIIQLAAAVVVLLPYTSAAWTSCCPSASAPPTWQATRLWKAERSCAKKAGRSGSSGISVIFIQF